MNKRQRKKNKNYVIKKISKKKLEYRYRECVADAIKLYQENKELKQENEELKAKLNKPKTTRKKKVEEVKEGE